jgi:hypothetical protein
MGSVIAHYNPKLLKTTSFSLSPALSPINGREELIGFLGTSRRVMCTEVSPAEGSEAMNLLKH